MAPIYLGGCIRALCDKRLPQTSDADPGILAASGLVAGEGLAGVVVAGLVASGIAPRSHDPRIPGIAGELVALALIGAIAAFLWISRSRSRR